MASREEIISTVKEFLSEEFEVEKSTIEPEANLQETLDLDSLDYVDLVVVIEENFGFKVTGEDFVGVVSFNDFYDLVEKKLAEK
ncbi:MAG: acyl carrier protein [Flavobacteriales bacterium]|nr:MAG: acyl carrier protein [Flavobacteriales bacterium]